MTDFRLHINYELNEELKEKQMRSHYKTAIFRSMSMGKNIKRILNKDLKTGQKLKALKENTSQRWQIFGVYNSKKGCYI